MKSKWLAGGVAVLVVIGLSMFALLKVRAYRDRQELDHELDLAHQEGIPITWKDYAGGIPTAKPEENAAPFYKSLSGLRPKGKEDPTQLDVDLYRNPGPSTIEAAKRELTKQSRFIAAVDQAAKLPRCWFNRDWNKGLAVLMPEYSDMKSGTKWIALRGSIAAAQGDSASAIRDIDEVFAVGKHASEEGTLISILVGEAIDGIGLHHLALWAFTHRDHPEYLLSFKAHLKDWQIPNTALVNRGTLLELRDVLEMSTTPQGRRDLGLKDSDISPAENFFPLIVSRSKADIKIARGMRQICEAYRLPPKDRIGKIDAAWKTVLPSLVAYPTGSDIYMRLSAGQDGSNESTDHSIVLADVVAAARKQAYEALVPVLERQSIPKSLTLPQFASPFDGTPATVQFDGKQITVTVSISDKKIDIYPLKLPSDKELGRPGKSKP